MCAYALVNIHLYLLPYMCIYVCEKEVFLKKTAYVLDVHTWIWQNVIKGKSLSCHYSYHKENVEIKTEETNSA